MYPTDEEDWASIDELVQLVDEMEDVGLIPRDGPEALYELIMQQSRAADRKQQSRSSSERATNTE